MLVWLLVFLAGRHMVAGVEILCVGMVVAVHTSGCRVGVVSEGCSLVGFFLKCTPLLQV